jgi:S-(hydroxymethyl)glutathione dehydrogenase/alcohol dehydrogenase
MTRAAVLTNYGDPLELWDIEWEPLIYGQVRLRVLSSGICGAQLQEIAGFKGNHLPRLLGHEGVAEVLEIGPGVKTVKVGDKACIHWRPGAGIESVNPEWNCDHGRYSAGLCTTFSEETVVSENRCTAIPWDTSIDLAVLLGCSLSTALGTLEETKFKMGESLLVIGCGGLGASLLYAAKFFHPSVLMGVDQYEKKGMFPSECQTYFGNWINEVHQTFDVVVDTTGDSLALEAAVERLNPGGRVVMVNPDTAGIITHRFRLAEINEALDVVRKGEAGRVLLEM